MWKASEDERRVNSTFVSQRETQNLGEVGANLGEAYLPLREVYAGSTRIVRVTSRKEGHGQHQ